MSAVHNVRHCGKGRGTLNWDAHKILGCRIRKYRRRLNLVPEWPPHCGTGHEYMPVAGNSVAW
jgi:hypothetical protein